MCGSGDAGQTVRIPMYQYLQEKVEKLLTHNRKLNSPQTKLTSEVG